MIWLAFVVVIGGLIGVRIYQDRKAQQLLHQVQARRVERADKGAELGAAYGMSSERAAQLAARRAAQDRSSQVIPTPPRNVVVDSYNPLLDPLHPVSPVSQSFESSHDCSSHDSYSYGGSDSGGSDMSGCSGD